MVKKQQLREVDPRLPTIVLRGRRRQENFEGTHSWRRYYSAAKRVLADRRGGKYKDPFLSEIRTPSIDYGGFEPVENRQFLSVIDDKINPDDVGTNAILGEFGMTLKQRDETFAFYGKHVIKAASRVAVLYARTHGIEGIRQELPHIFEAVYWLGKGATIELLVKEGKRPSEFMTSKQMDVFLSPRQAIPTLERIARRVEFGIYAYSYPQHQYR